MFNKGKLFATVLFSVSACASVATAQTAPSAPSAPSAPRTPGTITQVFSNSGGYLGIESQEVTKENFSKFGLRDVRGVAIERVMEDSPAAQAGLQVNDVVVRFNGEEVTSGRKLSRLISEVSPDHQVKMTVLRGGSERDLNVTIGKRTVANFGEGSFTFSTPGTGTFTMPQITVPYAQTIPNFTPAVPGVQFGDGATVYSFGSSRQIGVSVSSLGKQLGEYFGVSEGKGLLINNVGENSPAAKAGLKAGDVIIEVDGKSVTSNSSLSRAISEKKEGAVTLTIIRNKNRQTISVTPEKRDNAAFELFNQENGAVRVLPGQRLRSTAPLRVAPSVRAVPGVRVSPSIRTLAPSRRIM